MTTILTLPPKFLRLVIEAIEFRIAAYEEKYRTSEPGDDDAGDYGNDLTLFM